MIAVGLEYLRLQLWSLQKPQTSFKITHNLKSLLFVFCCGLFLHNASKFHHALGRLGSKVSRYAFSRERQKKQEGKTQTSNHILEAQPLCYNTFVSFFIKCLTI